MQLDRSIITELQGVPWLQCCGSDLPDEVVGVQKVIDESHALSSFASDDWADVKTEAQGDLTGYLSKYHYSDYGGYWNNLVKEATKLIEGVALEQLRAALQRRGWSDDFCKPIIVDLIRAVVEVSYRAKFRKAPAFFGTVLAIYKSGHLPCGWSGTISRWPEGSIIAY
jgi:hypothetical protein